MNSIRLGRAELQANKAYAFTVPEAMERPRAGDWMQTSSGSVFWPLDPHADEVHIEDIAAALSMLCRYGGHCHTFYSVAEHCVLLSRAAPKHLKFEVLMHDASEAYLQDVIRPIKSSLTNYRAIEFALEKVIAEKFGLTWPMPDEVKRLDNAILADERDQAMRTPPREWGLTEPALGVNLEFWTPSRAEQEFTRAFYELRV